MSERILIYGVPGTGKSAISELLAKRLGHRCFELDGLRSKAKQLVSQSQDPFLYEYTTEAWQRFGKFNRSNVISGFLAIRISMTKYIVEELDRQKDSFVAEAAFIDPELAKSMKATPILIIATDEYRHYSQFFENRPKSGEGVQQFAAARYIQDFLIEESENLGISNFNNTDTPSVAAQQIEKFLARH